MEESKKIVDGDIEKLPNWVTYLIVGICITPVVFTLSNVQFSTDVNSPSSAIIHSLFEWSAVMTAVFTVILASTHYLIKRDPVALIISLALVCSGAMDAFHGLAAIRLIEATAANEAFIPFTWAIGRFFNAVFCLIGVSIIIVKKLDVAKSNNKLVLITGASLILFSYIVIHACAVSVNLPKSQFPDSLMARPWDIIPLIAFVATVFAYKKLYKFRPGPFTHSLIVSTIPHIACQLYMIFGTTGLFDGHFYIAHGLKVLAYMVPFIGLTFEYIRTYLKEIESESIAANATKFSELGQMAAGVAHEINNPLTAINGFACALRMKAERGKLTTEDAVKITQSIESTTDRISAVVKSMRRYARKDMSEGFGNTCLAHILNETFNLCMEKFKSNNIELICSFSQSKSWPVICREIEISQVVLNLLNNACDAIEELPEKWVKVEINEYKDSTTELIVTDSGERPATKQIEKMFEPYFTTKEIGKGTGLGLSLCKEIVKAHGGEIFLNESSKNTQFIMRLRKGHGDTPNKAAAA